MTVIDRTYTVGLPDSGGPAAIALNLDLPDAPVPFTIEAWVSNFGSSNIYILDGDVPLLDAANRLPGAPGNSSNNIDCIMAISPSAPTRAGLPIGTNRITIYFEAANTSGQTQSVTVRVRG